MEQCWTDHGVLRKIHELRIRDMFDHMAVLLGDFCVSESDSKNQMTVTKCTKELVVYKKPAAVQVRVCSSLVVVVLNATTVTRAGRPLPS